ncbi:MAG: hypothetical protein [Siphoviridae sp. ct7UA22]|nr:MAG: hypothetical protein [Siphoviridae sp. ct7UA22]
MKLADLSAPCQMRIENWDINVILHLKPSDRYARIPNLRAPWNIPRDFELAMGQAHAVLVPFYQSLLGDKA